MTPTEDESKDTAQTTPPKGGYIDTAEVGLELHLLIKDTGSNEIIINQRG